MQVQFFLYIHTFKLKDFQRIHCMYLSVFILEPKCIGYTSSNERQHQSYHTSSFYSYEVTIIPDFFFTIKVILTNDIDINKLINICLYDRIHYLITYKLIFNKSAILQKYLC